MLAASRRVGDSHRFLVPCPGHSHELGGVQRGLLGRSACLAPLGTLEFELCLALGMPDKGARLQRQHQHQLCALDGQSALVDEGLGVLSRRVGERVERGPELGELIAAFLELGLASVLLTDSDDHGTCLVGLLRIAGEVQELAKEFWLGLEVKEASVETAFLGREVQLDAQHVQVDEPLVFEMTLPFGLAVVAQVDVAGMLLLK